MPELSDQLLAHIPRLETVRLVLAHAQEPFRKPNCVPSESEARLASHGGMLIKLAAAFDALQQSGLPIGDVIGALLAQPTRFDEAAVLALKELYAESQDTRKIQEVSILGLRAGMIFVEDVVTKSGMLLVAGGFEVTPTVLERLRNYESGTLPDKIRVAPVAAAPSCATVRPTVQM